MGKRACVHSASANTPLSSTPPSWHLKFSGKSSDRLLPPLPSFLPSFPLPLPRCFLCHVFVQSGPRRKPLLLSLPPSLALSLPLALLSASAATAHSLSHPLEKVDFDNNTFTPTTRFVPF